MRLVRDEALMWLPRPKSTYSVLRSAGGAGRGGEEMGKKKVETSPLRLTFTAGTGSEEQQPQQQHPQPQQPQQRFTTPRGTTCNMQHAARRQHAVSSF